MRKKAQKYQPKGGTRKEKVELKLLAVKNVSDTVIPEFRKICTGQL